MPLFIGELISGVVGLVELFCHAVWASLQILFGESESGGRRFSLKRLLLFPLPILLFLGLIKSVFLFADWDANRRAEMRAETQRLVDEEAERLSTQLQADGRFLRHASKKLDAEDAWGNPLQVSYESGVVNETLRVASAGHDGEFGTLDDIKAKHSLLLPKADIAAGVLNKAVDHFKKRRQEPAE